MRLLLTSILVLATTPALASSLTPLTGGVGNHSVVVKSCGDCPPLKPKDDTAYKVPVLDGAPQKTEIVEIDGQKKVVRTEAWLGGSPVVHVSAMQDWMAESQNAKADATATERSPQGDVIDPHTQTGAVASMAEAALPETLNLDQFQLRMN